MRFELTSEHREFFFQHHFIELSDVISEEECKRIHQLCDETMGKQFGNAPLDKATEEELYLAGRDLFRFDDQIKRFVQKRQFGELFSQISHKRPLRLLYTQYLRTFDTISSTKKQLPFLHSGHTLEASASFQGVYGGIVITLSTSHTTQIELSIQDDVHVICPIASKAGNAVLIHASSPLSFDPLFHSENEAHLLIVFGEQNAVYRRSEQDPLTHFPKTLGYSFGDLLKEEFNPIIYR